MVKATKKVSFGTKIKKFLNNPKHVVLVVFVLGFAAFGSYKIYSSYAYNDLPGGKSSSTVSGCYTTAVQGGSGFWLRPGSSGTCVNTAFKALNAINNADLVPLSWPTVPLDGKYGGESDRYNEDYNSVHSFQISYGIESSGTIGPQTWSKLNTVCAQLAGC